MSLMNITEVIAAIALLYESMVKFRNSLKGIQLTAIW